ncbi:MAG: sodium:calcium antiporter [Firmicutes bacterium]|nr:sodium:calcium antiporter [Bacillota bacterium]
MFFNILILVAGLVTILVAAHLFTNGVEWLGKRLNLSEGAVGSVLAAVGTALPETMVPVIAILFGPAGTAHEVGIGAILGAPFMLSTLAFAVVGLSKLICCRAEEDKRLRVNRTILVRDLRYFLGFYSLALVAAFIPSRAVNISIALILAGGYAYYVKKTFGCGEEQGECEVPPLILWRKSPAAPLPVILVQVGVSLGLIAAGAHFFVDSISHLADRAMVPALLLSLIITPVATELPEKFNSVVWVRGGKDTLAVGNITGAMVFQSTIIPALGIAFTPWKLTFLAALSAGLAILSSVFVLFFALRGKDIKASVMLYPAAIYGIFVLLVLSSF